MLEYFIRFFVFGKAIRHVEDRVMSKEMETTKPHEQTKQSTMAHYVDGFVIPLPKKENRLTALLSVPYLLLCTATPFSFGSDSSARAMRLPSRPVDAPHQSGSRVTVFFSDLDLLLLPYLLVLSAISSEPPAFAAAV
jgi:hypothetical protein